MLTSLEYKFILPFRKSRRIIYLDTGNLKKLSRRMKLSKYFTKAEFEYSNTALSRGFPNTMLDEETIESAKALCVNVLDPVREEFGPVRLTSGYRSPQTNLAVKGSRTSKHIVGQAADFSYAQHSDVTVIKWIKAHLDFYNVILEHHNPNDMGTGWIHVAYKTDGTNKRQVLSKSVGKPYESGLVCYVDGERIKLV